MADDSVEELRAEVAQLRAEVDAIPGRVQLEGEMLIGRMRGEITEAALDQRAKLEALQRRFEELFNDTAGALADIQSVLGKGRSTTRFQRLVPPDFGEDPRPVRKAPTAKSPPRSSSMTRKSSPPPSKKSPSRQRPRFSPPRQQSKDVYVLPEPLPAGRAGTYLVLRDQAENASADVGGLLNYAQRERVDRGATHMLINFRAKRWAESIDNDVQIAVDTAAERQYFGMRPIVVIFTDSDGGLEVGEEFTSEWARKVPHLIVAYPWSRYPLGTTPRVGATTKPYLRGAKSLEEVYARQYREITNPK